MKVVDAVEPDLSCGVSKVKLLVYTAVSVNVTSNFLFHVLLAATNLVSYSCPKVYQALNPWEGIPHRYISCSFLGLDRNAMHLVLHLMGFGSVENLRLWDAANSSHVFRMSCKADRDGAITQLSRLQTNRGYKKTNRNTD